MKQTIKRFLLPQGATPHTIRRGLLAGLRMELDFAHHTQLWLGLMERELAPWFRRFSRDIRTAVDVGANEGAYTLFLLARTPAQKVLAFEPVAENLPRLQRNLALNRLNSDPRLTIVPKFVGSTAGNDSTTLDANREEICPPCLIKVDVDGGEVDLLQGAKTILHTPGVRWIIEVHSQELEERCVELLRLAGYRTQVVPNAWWRHLLPELRPIAWNRWLIADQGRL